MVKLQTWNICQATAEERYSQTQWSVRAPRVLARIRAMAADVVHLQELAPANHPERWLSELGVEYRFVMAYRNPDRTLFAHATVYNHERLFPVYQCQQWLSETPDWPSDTVAKGVSVVWLCL